MTSGDSNFNYFLQNQLQMQTAESKANKGGMQNKFKSRDRPTNNVRAKRAKNLFLNCCTQNCRIPCYAFLGNLPPKKYSPQFSIFFNFPPTSRRHLPPPVNGVDPPGPGLYKTRPKQHLRLQALEA